MKILILVFEDSADIAPLIAAIPSGSVLCGIGDTDAIRAADSLKAFAAGTTKPAETHPPSKMSR